MCASHLSYVCLLRAGNRAACWSPVGGHIRSAMCAHKGHAGVARHVLEAMSLWDPAALVANAMHDIRDAATFTVYAFVHARRMYTACLSSMIWVPGMSREAAGRRDGREISPLIVSHLQGWGERSPGLVSYVDSSVSGSAAKRTGTAV